MRKRYLILGLLLAVCIVAGGAVWSAYRASQQVPAFYREAIAQQPTVQKKASDELLQHAAALASDVRKPGRWQAVFSAEQINGWLAIDLVENYPELLETEIRDPRAEISPRRATLACRYTSPELSTVLSLTFDVYLSAPNVVAVRIRTARAGVLPVPLSEVLDGISSAAETVGLPLEWRQTGGDPVAMITIPPPRDQHDRFLELDTIELRDGEVYLAGHTTRHRTSDDSDDEPAPSSLPTAQAEAPALPRWVRSDLKDAKRR